MASEHLHISGSTVVQHVRDVADFRRALGYRLDFGAFGEKPRRSEKLEKNDGCHREFQKLPQSGKTRSCAEAAWSGDCGPSDEHLGERSLGAQILRHAAAGLCAQP